MCKPKMRHVYLSPHLDDAALSCGGLIHQQAQRGERPLVITCFAGVPDYHALSPFAAEQHRRWGQPVDPVEKRRCEDAAALSYLGAQYQHCDYLDCIYRSNPDSAEPLYASEEALFGPLCPEERGRIAELTTRLATCLVKKATQIYAPLAVGHHVDHRFVLQAAAQLREQGFQVQFYEDYPYAEDAQKLAGALSAWALSPTPQLVTLGEQDVQARIRAIRLYRSQLETLFASESAVAERVLAFARALGDGHCAAERYWQGGTLSFGAGVLRGSV